jgi:ribosomal-protein-alanine N-acetyltransferase
LKPIISLRGIKKNSVIYSIAVDRNFRRKGFGEKLLAESVKEMKLNKISSVLLYVDIKNPPAIRLYEKVGFRIVKEIDDVCGQNEKCYEMELKLA